MHSAYAGSLYTRNWSDLIRVCTVACLYAWLGSLALGAVLGQRAGASTQTYLTDFTILDPKPEGDDLHRAIAELLLVFNTTANFTLTWL